MKFGLSNVTHERTRQNVVIYGLVVYFALIVLNAAAKLILKFKW
jgi:hypothetical protein